MTDSTLQRGGWLPPTIMVPSGAAAPAVVDDLTMPLDGQVGGENVEAEDARGVEADRRLTSVGRQSVKGRLTFESKRERLLIVLLIGGLWTVPVEAQEHPQGHTDRLPLSGHIFAGGGWFFDEGTIDTGPFSGPDTPHTVFRHTSSAWQLGGGVEWQFWRSVGAVAEASVTVVDEQPNGILSLNAVYHFQRTETAAPVVVPFVTGGYSFVGMERGVNVGAGVTYRFHREVGLRLEARGIQLLRDHQYEFVPRPWLVEMSLGLSF